MKIPDKSQHRNPSRPHLPSPTLVDNAAQFERMVADLHGQPLIAIDTESDSLFRYYPRVCLIQITIFADAQAADPNQVVDYLVDPLSLDEMSGLRPLLADPAIEIIVHAASNDILIMQRDFGFEFTNVFDTQLAARVLGWQQIGLASILSAQFDVASDKRMQRTNWGTRPLSGEQVTYAQIDTHYLPALRARLLAELRELDRLEEAQEAFLGLEQIDYREREQSPRSFWQMKSTRDVPLAQMGVLQALWEWREHEAQRQDRPPFKIANDQALSAMAMTQPRKPHDLRNIRGISESQIRRYGSVLLRTIQEGQRRPQPTPPRPKPRPEWTLDGAVQIRFDALRQWRTGRANARDVDPDIVFSNDTLMAIAHLAPKTLDDFNEISDIGPWKRKTYGQDVLKLLSELGS